MKKRRGKRLLGIVLAVCMMLTLCPHISDGINGSGHADAAVKVPPAKKITYKLTGDQAKDIVGIAKTQIGYKEGKRYYDKKRSYVHVPTAYGKYFGYDYEWCAVFVCWSARKAGIKKKVIPYSTSADPGKFAGKYYKRGKITPKKGDLIFFGNKTHVGLVDYVKNGYVYTVEGNTGNGTVKQNHFKLNNPWIMGYKRPSYKTKKIVNSHTISYSLNGGSGSFKSQTVKDGAQIVLPTTKPTKAGYSFRGWYVKRSDNTWYALSAGWTSWDTITKKKYTPKTYTPGSSYTLDGSWTKGKANGSYTFYAQWAKTPTATLKFHPNGGTGSMPQKTIALNDGAMAFETLNQFRREGYTLNGWKVQKLHNGSEYWVVADGNGWKWKKDATVSERKLYRYTDAFTFRKGSAEAGDTIVVWASWKGAEKGSQTIEDGDYHIVSAVDPRYGLDVCGGSDRNETNVQVYQNTENDEQTFHVTYIGDGYYEIISNISGKSLDVAGAKVANRTNVQIYEQNGNDAQKWIIKDMGNGNYSIFSKCGGLCLDLTGARAANGTNVQMYQDDGSLEQKWRFVEVEDETSQDAVNADQDGDDIDQNEDTDDSDDPVQKENEQDPFEEGGKTETDLNNGQTENQDNQEGENQNSTGQTDNNGTVIGETDPVIPAEEDVDPVYVWSDWSEYSTEPVEADENCEVETKTEYRFRDKQTVTSGRDELSGYTKESTSASSPVYGIWGANQQTASTNITDAKKTVVTVETKNAYKAYAWYCKCKKVCWHKKTATCKYCGKKTDYGKVTIYSEKPVTNYKKDTDGSYFLSTTVKVASSFGKLGQVYCIGWRGDKVQSFTTGSKVGNKNTFVWPDGRATVYRTKTVNYVNTFSKWGGWSGWSETQYNASGTRQVESRTLYRYRTLTAE